jgi:pSer/pThr/pTyr-binding forkhead associated (FHA) protein
MRRNPLIKLLPDGPYVEIDGDSLFLGRDCHLAMHIPALKSRYVSNRHCCIKRGPDAGWTLEDLSSRNGTWMGDVRLSAPEPINSGDIFSLGRSGPCFACRVPPAALEETLAESGEQAVSTSATSDGSAEHPYRSGRSPSINLKHERTGEVFDAKGYTIVLGRDPSVQVVIRSEEEKHISSRHAQVMMLAEGRCVLQDLKSRNGTWLNGKRLAQEADIVQGDAISLGSKRTTLLVIAIDAGGT